MSDIKQQYPRRILVEGMEDKHVILSLLNKENIRTDVNVQPMGGIDKLVQGISTAVLDSRLETVGIVADANSSSGDRWRKLCAPLRQCGYSPRVNPSLGGTILEATKTVQKKRGAVARVGIWVMPNNKSPGTIEDFATKMVPAGDLDWKDATQYVRSIPPSRRRFKEDKTVKVTMRVWLATRTEPNHMGSAISKGDLLANGPLCQKFCSWLKLLLN